MPICFLANFADEVASGRPAAITAASQNQAAADSVQALFEGSPLRVYASKDPVGVAIGGAMKNVIAIAAGCASGLGLRQCAPLSSRADWPR